MKVLLGCLMCLVLTVVQTFAISGGPWGGRGQVSVTGTYAGVLVPLLVVVDPGPPPVTLPPDNSLALFTMKIPQTGVGSGTIAVFRNGFTYSGTMTASADPDTAKLTAVVTAIRQITVGDTTIVHFYEANGQFNGAKLTSGERSSATGGVRIKGRASLTYQNDAGDPAGDSGGPIQYRVRGFKQSESSS